MFPSPKRSAIQEPERIASQLTQSPALLCLSSHYPDDGRAALCRARTQSSRSRRRKQKREAQLPLHPCLVLNLRFVELRAPSRSHERQPASIVSFRFKPSVKPMVACPSTCGKLRFSDPLLRSSCGSPPMIY